MDIDTEQIRTKFKPVSDSQIGGLCDHVDLLRGQIAALEVKLLELEIHAARANTAVAKLSLDVSPAELAALDAAGKMAGRMAQHHRPTLDQMRLDLERVCSSLAGHVAALDGYDTRAAIKIGANRLVPTIRGEWVKAQKRAALDLLGHEELTRTWHDVELRPNIY